MASIDLLVTTFGKTDEEARALIESLNLKGHILLGNQNGQDRVSEFVTSSGANVTLYDFASRGVSKNRNALLDQSQADIVSFLDDDVHLNPDYLDKVNAAFLSHEESSAIRFNIASLNPKIPATMITKEKTLSFYDLKGANCAGVFIKRDFLIKNHLRFDETLGPGTSRKHGEDTLFLFELCQKEKAFVQKNETLGNMTMKDSSWFTGYNAEFLTTSGYLFRKMYGPKFSFVCHYYLFKHHKQFVGLSLKEQKRLLKQGAKECDDSLNR
jgi:glycosyltransferase involved in cell wall biosynthesis